MKRVVQVKLVVTPEQAAVFDATLRACNLAAGFLSEISYTARSSRGVTPNKYKLQKLAYQDVKARFGLSAQPALLVISKTAGAYKTLRTNIAAGRYGPPGSPGRVKAESKPVTFRAGAAQPFDDRCLSWQYDARTVSIWTVAGRLQGISFVGEPAQVKDLIKFRKGETDLVKRGRDWFLIATLDEPTPQVKEPVNGFLGVDLGIVNVAYISDGANWSGGAVTLRRKNNIHLRKVLQKRGTKSAKRLLKKRSKKESRFAADVNHQISKSIVVEAERTGRGIAVENLTGIRERARLRKPQRTMLHSWAFAQLGGFLTYKAQRAGVELVPVPPAYTSQTCNACGHCEKPNRNGEGFACRSCGVVEHSDWNAARNIRDFAQGTWVGVNRPNAA